MSKIKEYVNSIFGDCVTLNEKDEIAHYSTENESAKGIAKRIKAIPLTDDTRIVRGNSFQCAVYFDGKFIGNLHGIACNCNTGEKTRSPRKDYSGDIAKKLIEDYKKELSF